jgi:hypothetical protein
MSDVPDDVQTAIRYAQGLFGPVNPDRLDAMTALLLVDLRATAGRIRGAREYIEQRRASDAASSWDDDACMLLTHALERLAASSISGKDQQEDFHARLKQEHFPETQPYFWDRHRRDRWTWRIRRLLATMRVRLSQQPATDVRAPARVEVRLGARPVGWLKYFVCDQCHLVLVGELEIQPKYQGIGLGSHTITSMFRRYRHHEWRTTAQYDTSGTFWPNMAAKTGASFTHGEPCQHMMRRDDQGNSSR